MIGIELHDADGLLRALPWRKRRAIGVNLRMGCAPVNMPQAALSIPLPQLHDEIVRRFATASGRA